jgi:hypothetical protein
MTAFVVLMSGTALAQQVPPAPPPLKELTPDLTQKLAHRIADLLEENYVDPATGRRYAAMLRSNASGGQTISDPAAFARQMTADLRAVAADAHLRIIPPGQALPMMRVGGPAPGPGGVPVIGSNEPARALPGPQGTGAVQAAHWIAPGIAYIRLASMAGDPATVAAVERFMKDHAEAHSIIIDSRANPGGGSGPADVILPYLYAEPTVLVQMDTRAEPDADGRAPFAEGPLIRKVASPTGVVRRERSIHPHPRETRLFDAKVFYLTSKRTASAAETMALALKRTNRGIVIGETTAGAGHFGSVYELDGGFSIFLPIGRTFDPDNGRGFERTGVTPNFEVPADQALREALKLAGLSDESQLEAAVVTAEAPAKPPSTGEDLLRGRGAG